MNVVKSKCNDQVDGYLTTDIDSAKKTWCNKILRKSKEKYIEKIDKEQANA